MRFSIPVLVVLAISACAPRVPASNSNDGFQPYGSYLKDHGTKPDTNGAAAAQAPMSATDLASDAGAAIDNADRPRGDAPIGIKQEHGERADLSSSISDEQDFNAVKSRETIQSDKERLAQQRAEYQVIQPTALPQRPASEGPNIVQYALNTHNKVGQKLYSRFNLLGAAATERACARYTSDDLAQEAFLAAGGPERDPKGLDPDGDGFACHWDPTPYRAAVK